MTAPRTHWSTMAALAAALALLAGATEAALPASLNPPFDLPAARTGGKQSTCDAPPPPVTELIAESVYKAGDPTHSIIDPEAKERYDEDVGPLRDFGQQIARMANRYIESKGADAGAADCTLSWLAAWARGGALGTLATRQAALSATRTLSGLALAYVQVRGAKGASADDKGTIEAWLDELGHRTMSVYGDEGHVALGNHRYWGGLTAGAIAVAAGDRTLFAFAMESYRLGVCQVRADGSLPIESSRGKRARDYHIHAAAPLVMLAELGARNGIDTYGECDGALHRLVDFIVTSIDDPAAIAKLAGAAQLPLGSLGSRLAWVAIYRSRFPLPDTAGLPKSLNATALGGNLTTLYGG